MNEELTDLDSTKIFFTDLNGKLMNLNINKNKLDEIYSNGVGFDGSSIAGYASVDNSDKILVPDKSTFKKINFGNNLVGFLIGNIFNEEGKLSEVGPRNVLQNVIKKAEDEFGYRFFAGPEHEFFLLKGNELNIVSQNGLSDKAHSDNAGYFHSNPDDRGESVRNSIVDVLASCGIHYEKSHHEVTPSQHEINLEYTDALKAADRTLLLTYITQRVAEENGCYASFMPKPFQEHNRNAFHIHISIMDSEGNNIFYDEKSGSKISDIARYFIGGILKYARETSLIMASTVNSYKAYVLEKEAPIVRGWGYRNRSSMVRVPYTTSPKGTRIELRSPDPAGNVYLQMAVLISMGLHGIREKIDCGAQDKGSTYNQKYEMKVWDEKFLPRSFYEALVEAERSRFLKDILGESLYSNFMKLKIKEWEEARVHISPREHIKYLNI